MEELYLEKAGVKGQEQLANLKKKEGESYFHALTIALQELESQAAAIVGKLKEVFLAGFCTFFQNRITIEFFQIRIKGLPF